MFLKSKAKSLTYLEFPQSRKELEITVSHRLAYLNQKYTPTNEVKTLDTYLGS